MIAYVDQTVKNGDLPLYDARTYEQDAAPDA